MATVFHRHDLVWLDPDLELEQCLGDKNNMQLASHWVACGRPLVVARQPGEDGSSAGALSLGFTTPPPLTRKRVALAVPRGGVVRHSAPLTLAEALPHAPLWQEPLRRLAAVCSDHGAVAKVYGSLSWQAHTGCSYLTEKSDLDLLLVCGNQTRLLSLFAALDSFADTGPRLDGEVLSPTGWAAAWRELAAALHRAGSTVLAKSDYQTRLLTVDSFLGLPAGKREA